MNETKSKSSFSISEAASARIGELLKAENKPDAYFRIAVEGGGCSGFQYKFEVDNVPPAAQDVVLDENGARVVIDDISLGFLADAQLDFVETLAESAFQIKNPNSTAQCGCGSSFSIA